MSDLELSVIIPAYLEEENLRVILPRTSKVLHDLNAPYEVLVIDTMQSMDNTSQVCMENGAIYMNRENGNYYGNAVRTGIKYAEGKYVVFMDADGSHSPEFIKELYQFRNEYDVVIASRYVKGGGSDNSPLLKLMSYLVNVTFSVFFRLGCRDVSNSFKLYRATLLKDLKLASNNFDVIEEMLIKLKRKNRNIRFKEVPFFFKERMFGHTKRNLLMFILSYLGVMLRLMFMK